MSTMQRLIAFGSALVDQLARVPDEFLANVAGNKGGMELIDRETKEDLLAALAEAPSRVPGGSAANTAVAAARLGLPSRLLAKIGDDEAGSFYRDSVASAGVETHTFKTDAIEATGTCISLVTPDSERTLRTYLGASATLQPEEISAADFDGCTHAHVEGYMLFNRQLMLHILETAKSCGCTVSIDLAAPEVVRSCRTILPAILREYADMVFANEEEAAEFARSSDERVCLDRLAEFAGLAVVKLGARGSLIRVGDQFETVSAKTVTAIDTTGAGDLWAAGFLFGMLTGSTVKQAGTIGSHLAAAVVQQLGAVLPDTQWTELKRELQLDEPHGKRTN